MVSIKAWGEVVAKLTELNGIYYFSLSPENSLNFSPIKLKEKAKSYEFSSLSFQNALPGLVNDSLPGVYGKEYLDSFFLKHFKTTPTIIETLQFLGENTMGALTYEPTLEHKNLRRENLILEASQLYDETKKALLGEADFSINEIIAISNSAAAGARPKAIVGFNKDTQKMHIGLKHTELPQGFVHAIVKFDNLLYNKSEAFSSFMSSSQTIGEYLYYLAATKAGVVMSPSCLVESDGYHFVTQRFDIEQNRDTIERLHMHSLSGMMHHNPAETTFGYENIFKICELLSISHEDKVQYFKTMLFNLIFGNTDDHSRNFSFLMDSKGKWRGAPAYDLTFSMNKRHQMMFEYKNGADVDEKHILKMAQEYNIKNAASMIEEMLEIKHSFLKELATQYGVLSWYEQVLHKTAKVFA